MKSPTRLQGFPERFQEAAYASGLTDQEIGDRCGKGRKTILAYRHGESTPDCLTLARLCFALGVSADFLLFGKATENNEALHEDHNRRYGAPGCCRRFSGRARRDGRHHEGMCDELDQPQAQRLVSSGSGGGLTCRSARCAETRSPEKRSPNGDRNTKNFQCIHSSARIAGTDSSARILRSR